MPHINTGGTTPINIRVDQKRIVSPINTTPADTNCSLCAAAGAITHSTGRFTTSGDVARENPPVFSGGTRLAAEFNGQVPAFEHSQVFRHTPILLVDTPGNFNRINAQVVSGMAKYVCRKIGCVYEIKQDNRDAVIAWMKNKMTSCVFTFLTEGHWVFAHKSSTGVLEFIDYQTDKPGGAPTVSAQPILGITNKVFGPSTTATATAIAFVYKPTWVRAYPT